MKFKENYFLPLKTVTVLIILFSVIAFISFGFKNDYTTVNIKNGMIRTRKGEGTSDQAGLPDAGELMSRLPSLS